MEIVAGSMNTDTRKKIQRSPSVVNSLKMLFRPKLSSDSKANKRQKNGNIIRSQSFANSRHKADTNVDLKLRRTMSTRSGDTSLKRCDFVKSLTTAVPANGGKHTTRDSKPETDGSGVHQHKDVAGTSPSSQTWQQLVPRERQSLPTIASCEPVTVDTKISNSFSVGCPTVVSDSFQELLPRPDCEDAGFRPAAPREMSRKFPIIDYLPHLSKSRCDKFHKLFKRVPLDEDPIDYYSCAFKGDILLHGFLYVSTNWVCFYSKIKGRGRLLEINLEKVISITREKMALFIPNAIGIQTADKKYVFGSFMSRDTTFRLLVSLWRLSQDSPDSLESSISSVSGSEYFETVTKAMDKDGRTLLLDRALAGPSSTDSLDDDDSDASSMCLQCGPIDMGDRGDTVTDCRGHRAFNDSRVSLQHQAGPRKPYFYLVRCLDFRKICRAFFHFAIQLQKIPRTSLMLAVCSILVFFLLISAICMAYKILLIQAKLELRSVWPHGTSYNDYVKGMIYAQEAGTHASIVNHLHTVLKSNIQLLQQIQSSLQSLYTKSGLNTCSKVDCP